MRFLLNFPLDFREWLRISRFHQNPSKIVNFWINLKQWRYEIKETLFCLKYKFQNTKYLYNNIKIKFKKSLKMYWPRLMWPFWCHPIWLILNRFYRRIPEESTKILPFLLFRMYIIIKDTSEENLTSSLR